MQKKKKKKKKKKKRHIAIVSNVVMIQYVNNLMIH